ncbi:serine protease [Hoeflea sp. AS60]|uniref:S1 family peptidase n=1 Tax=Hoeflea sp. AS60 TaxID=3135780 RepID=UPI003176D4EC
MRLSVALKYLRKTKGGIGYRREVPKELRPGIGFSTFTHPLGKTEAEAARNWSTNNAAFETLVKEARRALSKLPTTATPLTLFSDTLGYLRGVKLNPWEVGVEEADPASVALTTGREAAAEAIIDASPVGHDGTIQLSPTDERRVRALHSGMGSAPSPKLSEAVALYLTEQPAQATLKNRQRIGRIVRRLEAVAGKDPLVSEITRQDARAIRDKLVADAKAAGIANLVTNKDEHAGMGMLVSSRHVLTCAHVVNAARGRDAEAKEPNEGDFRKQQVEVRFPMLPVSTDTMRTGRIVAWRDVGETPLDDIAVIELDQDAPEEVGLALLADVSGHSLDGDRLSVFGIAPGRSIGNHVDARFMGQNTDAWIQVASSESAQDFIDGGYSGGAVWDNVHEAVVGMIVRKYNSDKERIAYMIPVADIAAFWPELPHERRTLSPSFMRGWTTFSIVFFLLLLVHFQAERGTEMFQPISMGQSTGLLNAFWGMHLFAFLAPILFFMFLAFARSRQLHPWWQRVPSFGSFHTIPVASSMRRTAVLTLTLLILLPLAAQVHFIRKVLSEGHLYIYAHTFGYEAGQLEGCTAEAKPVCIAPSEGLMDLVEPINGKEGGYWDNAYHFGPADADKGSTVTFFPVLQQAVILGLTFLSFVVAGFVIHKILANPSKPRLLDS